eukprot:5873371-Pleurochrysis_carterae.AAC.3
MSREQHTAHTSGKETEVEPQVRDGVTRAKTAVVIKVVTETWPFHAVELLRRRCSSAAVAKHLAVQIGTSNKPQRRLG